MSIVYVCFAEAVAIIVVVSASASLVRSLIRQQARERDLLINKILHSTGRPWVQAPVDVVDPVLAEADADWPSWTATPEQDPVY